jgi:general secretion pathway protein L
MLNAVIANYLSDLQRRYQSSRLPAFVSWWSSALMQLVPETVQRRFMPPAPQLVLVADVEQPGHFALWLRTDAFKKIDEFNHGEDIGLQRSRWQRHVNQHQDDPPRVMVLLPGEAMLDLDVDLPLAVEGNLAQALRFQLDQMTPFAADQLAYDHRVIRRDAANGRLHLSLRLIPSAVLDPVRDHLTAVGIRPHAIDTLPLSRQGGADEPPIGEGFNLIPVAQRPVYVHQRKRLNWTLAGALAVALVVVMAQSIYLRDRAVNQLRTDVAALRAEAESVMALQRDVDAALEAANFLADQRYNEPVTVQVVDELSRILPDHFWLQQLQIRGSTMILMGFAEGSQALIEILNDSPLFDDAEFRGRVSIDANSGEERFNAQARILPPGDPQHAVAAQAGP